MGEGKRVWNAVWGFITFFSFVRVCMKVNTFFAFIKLSFLKTILRIMSQLPIRFLRIPRKTLPRPLFKAYVS